MAVDFKDYARRMDKALDHLEEEFGAVRAGRANAKVLDRITVEYYGSETPLNGVATISTPDARTLVIAPWDTKLLKDIQKAIQVSDLASTPRMTAASSAWCSPSSLRSAVRIWLSRLRSTQKRQRLLCVTSAVTAWTMSRS